MNVKKILKRIYLIIVLIFLYIPVLVLMAQSFNSSKLRGNWTHFTFKWYISLFSYENIISALINTIVIGVVSVAVATLIGTMAAIAIAGYRPARQRVLVSVSNISMMNADIVTGISLMLLFIGMGIRFGSGSVLLSHIIFNIPYALMSVLPEAMVLDMSCYEAAEDLGARPLQAMVYSVIPELRNGIIAGFLLSFTMSADDFIITHFTKGAGFDTLPTKIYAELKVGIKPEMYALSTLMFFATMLLVFLMWRFRRKVAKAE